ncbi:MAG: type II toxin-antitoxin system Phd/YefM family antitoxin [bacterium]|nr:type II toxin-antitoxin system Phd/YefM family antitoxin [bacterium]
MHAWQLQEAKNRLSEVVDRALDQGPQMITRRGAETAVVLSIEDYRRINRPETDLVDFLQASPLAGVELDLERSRDTGREIDL